MSVHRCSTEGFRIRARRGDNPIGRCLTVVVFGERGRRSGAQNKKRNEKASIYIHRRDVNCSQTVTTGIRHAEKQPMKGR
jgi:hypothetical protein